MASGTTTIIASYSDLRAAELFAKFTAEAGIPCDVVEAASAGVAGYRVLVPTDRLGDVDRLLDLTVIAEYQGPTAAEVVAGRLVSEGIPCRLAGRGALDSLGFLGRFSGPYEITVPRSLLSRAQQIINQSPVSDEELTELALRTPPSRGDVI